MVPLRYRLRRTGGRPTGAIVKQRKNLGLGKKGQIMSTKWVWLSLLLVVVLAALVLARWGKHSPGSSG
jgi:hypothetical protein